MKFIYYFVFFHLFYLLIALSKFNKSSLLNRIAKNHLIFILFCDKLILSILLKRFRKQILKTKKRRNTL